MRLWLAPKLRSQTKDCGRSNKLIQPSRSKLIQPTAIYHLLLYFKWEWLLPSSNRGSHSNCGHVLTAACTMPVYSCRHGCHHLLHFLHFPFKLNFYYSIYLRHFHLKNPLENFHEHKGFFHLKNVSKKFITFLQ